MHTMWNMHKHIAYAMTENSVKPFDCDWRACNTNTHTLTCILHMHPYSIYREVIDVSFQLVGHLSKHDQLKTRFFMAFACEVDLLWDGILALCSIRADTNRNWLLVLQLVLLLHMRARVTCWRMCFTWNNSRILNTDTHKPTTTLPHPTHTHLNMHHAHWLRRPSN